MEDRTSVDLASLIRDFSYGSDDLQGGSDGDTRSQADEEPFSPEEHVEPEIAHLREKTQNAVGELEKLLGPLAVSASRRGMWEADFAKIQELQADKPATLIGIYGATGAGKSTLLNAVLDCTVIPTSGMRACTSVVTSVSFHPEETLKAEISFMQPEQWKEELRVLSQDLRKDDGTAKRTSDLTSEGRQAFQKVKAVYPTVTLDELSLYTVDEILDLDEEVKTKLGTTITVETHDSEDFLDLISPYITSSGPTYADDVNMSDFEDEQPAADMWPLILEVRIFCRAHALSSGATLVDLPGVADANLARDEIAKRYMKNCDYIWIVSPITRAVDEKVAHDLLGKAFRTQLSHGNYNAKAITFIASKCDDIVPTEITRGLGLGNDPELRSFDEQIKAAVNQSMLLKASRNNFEKLIKQLEGPKDAQKRKRPAITDAGATKRHCGTSRAPQREEHDLPVATPDLEMFQAELQKIEANMAELQIEIQMQSRKRKFYCSKKRSKALSAAIRQLQRDFRSGIREIDEEERERRDRDAFDPEEEARDYSAVNLPVFTCSSRDYLHLQGDDRDTGEPACFSDIQDTDIPRLQEWCHALSRSSVKRVALRQAAQALNLATSIQSFLQSQVQVSSLDCSMLRRKWRTSDSVLAAKSFDSLRLCKEDPPCEDSKGWFASSQAERSRRSLSVNGELADMEVTSRPKVATVKKEQEDAHLLEDETQGVFPRLILGFLKVSDAWIEGIRTRFNGLFQDCDQGARKCIDAAVDVHDTHASSVRWNTYRATLNHRGVWKIDLNANFVLPLQQHILHPWNKLFSADNYQLADIKNEASDGVKRLVSSVETSAVPGLQDRVHLLGEQCLKDTAFLIGETMADLEKTFNDTRKDLSRNLAVEVKDGLTSGYDTAMNEKGRGSVARQKDVFKKFLEKHKDELFTQTAQTIPTGIETAITAMAAKLEKDFEKIARRAEITLSALWEVPLNSHLSARDCQRTLEALLKIITELEFATSQAEAT